MKQSFRERRLRHEAFIKFLEANPPRMPESFTNKDYRRVEGYAFVAFCAGWNMHGNELRRKEKEEKK